MNFQESFSQSLRGLRNVWRFQKKTSIFLVANLEFFPFYNIARFHVGSPLYSKNLYDALEITPKANTNQVKKAYYKLSLIYHPDQNKSESAAIKFREISEAYEVLGNSSKRRMYDKKLLGLSPSYTPEEASAYSRNVAQSRDKRSKPAPASGRTPIYNFDEWSKLHSSKLFHRQKMDRENIEFIKMKNIRRKKNSNTSAIMTILFCLYIVYYYTIPYSFKDYDKVDDKSR